jgi:hypothetical protein
MSRQLDRRLRCRSGKRSGAEAVRRVGGASGPAGAALKTYRKSAQTFDHDNGRCPSLDQRVEIRVGPGLGKHGLDRSDADVLDADRFRPYPDKCAWCFGELRDPAITVWTLTWIGWAAAWMEGTVLAGNCSVASGGVTAFLPAVVTGPP